MSAINSTRDKLNGIVTTRDDNNIKVKLRSYEGNVFEISLAAARMSVLVVNMLESLTGDDGQINFDEPILLTNDGVTDEALKKIIEWCEYHWDDLPIDEDSERDSLTEELSHWDKNFIDVKSQALLFGIILAADYMDIKGLVEVGGKHIFNKIKEKILKITNDFSPEEEAEIHKGNEWIYATD